MPIFQCPRCEVGQMDSDKGEQTACWYCSTTQACYVCNGDQCGLKICRKDLEKVMNQKAAATKPIPFRRGEIGDGGG